MIDWLLYAHLLGVVVFFAGSGAYSGSVHRLPRSRTVSGMRALLSVSVLGSRTLNTGVGVLIVAGVTLVITRWSFAQGWIAASLVLVAAQGACGLVVDRRVARVEDALGDAGDGPVPADVAVLAADRIMHGVDRMSIAILAELMFLMVAKPSGVALAASLLVAAAAAAALATMAAYAAGRVSIDA